MNSHDRQGLSPTNGTSNHAFSAFNPLYSTGTSTPNPLKRKTADLGDAHSTAYRQDSELLGQSPAHQHSQQQWYPQQPWPSEQQLFSRLKQGQDSIPWPAPANPTQYDRPPFFDELPKLSSTQDTQANAFSHQTLTYSGVTAEPKSITQSHNPASISSLLDYFPIKTGPEAIPKLDKPTNGTNKGQSTAMLDSALDSLSKTMNFSITNTAKRIPQTSVNINQLLSETPSFSNNILDEIDGMEIPAAEFDANSTFVVTPMNQLLDDDPQWLLPFPSSIGKTQIQLSTVQRPKYLEPASIPLSQPIVDVNEQTAIFSPPNKPKIDDFLDLSTERSLISMCCSFLFQTILTFPGIPRRKILKNDLKCLFFRPVNDYTSYTSDNVITVTKPGPMRLLLAHIPIQDAFQAALSYFDQTKNPEAWAYLNLYHNLIFLKGNTFEGQSSKSVFQKMCLPSSPGTLHTNLIPTHNQKIWDFITELKRQSLLRDTNNNTLEELSSGLKTIKVCSNLCFAYTGPQYVHHNNPIPGVEYRCPRCASTETTEFNYTSPRLLVKQMMCNPSLSRLIKTSPTARTKNAIENVFESEVVRKLREKGYLKTVYELLFCLSLVNTNVYKTANGIELIQINLVLLNLPPSERYLQENLFPIFYLPKFTSNWHSISIDSYFQAIVNDFKDMGSLGFRVYDGDIKQWKLMKAHLGFITGDLSSVSMAMGYAYKFGNYPCRMCGAKTCNVEEHHYDFGNPADLDLNELVKDGEWYRKFQSFMDIESGRFPEDISKLEGICYRNAFLELDTIFLPDSFPFDFINFYYSSTIRKILTLSFSFTEPSYKRNSIKYSQTIEAHNRFCHVLDFFNRALPYHWLKEKFDYEKMLTCQPGSITPAQAKQFLELFPIIYFEALSDENNKNVEDVMILELTLAFHMCVSPDLTPQQLDFLENALDVLIRRFETIIVQEYTNGATLSIFSLAVHSITHITYYIRKCGTLSSFNSHLMSKSYNDFSDIQDDDVGGGYSSSNSNSIRKIMDFNLQNLAVRLLLPSENTFRTGSCTLVEPRRSYAPIDRSWETLSLMEKYQSIESNSDSFATAIFYSKLNRLVWRFFKRNKTFQLCVVDPLTKAVSFPNQNDLFLDPAQCERFRACLYGSSKTLTRVDSIARLKSKDKARYGLMHDFVRVRFYVANPDGTNVREMEKSFVLFTELTTQLKKIEVPTEVLDPRLVFPKGTTNFGPPQMQSDGQVGLKSSAIYGYYYTFAYDEKDAADDASYGRLYCEPPAEQRWDVAPVESLSNPVYSVPIVSRDQKTVNVHLFDIRYQCELQVGNKVMLVDGCGAEYDHNESYEKAFFN